MEVEDTLSTLNDLQLAAKDAEYSSIVAEDWLDERSQQ